MASDFCNWTRGGRQFQASKLYIFCVHIGNAMHKRVFHSQGIMRGTKGILDQNDNIEINSFGLQHDCNCLYIEHILCFNIHTYKLIRLQGAEYDKPSCFTNAIKRGTENQHSFPLQGEQTQLYLQVEITTPFPKISFFSKPRRNHHHYNAPHPPFSVRNLNNFVHFSRRKMSLFSKSYRNKGKQSQRQQNNQ